VRALEQLWVSLVTNPPLQMRKRSGFKSSFHQILHHWEGKNINGTSRYALLKLGTHNHKKTLAAFKILDPVVHKFPDPHTNVSCALWGVAWSGSLPSWLYYQYQLFPFQYSKLSSFYRVRQQSLTHLKMCLSNAGGRAISTKGSKDCALAAQRMSVLILDLRFVRSSVFVAGML
jgi:hypothetical protein